MTESGPRSSAAAVAATAKGVNTSASAGALLRAAREQQGLHIAALAAAIKVTPRKLDALEGDRWSELPDATFARALAQTVCRTLKIDPRPVLALLPAAGSTSIEPHSRTAHTPFRERSGRDSPGIAGSAIRPMLWAAALLMVAALVVYFTPESVWRSSTSDRTTETAAPAFPDAVPAVSTAQGDAEPAAAGDAASAASAASDAVAAMSAPAVVAAAPQPLAAAGLAASVPSTSSKAVANGQGVLQVKVSKDSWIQIRGAGGEILISRDVAAGESLGFDGTAPFRLIIGNAAATQLMFRGQPVDLTPSLRGNVARLVLP